MINATPRIVGEAGGGAGDVTSVNGQTGDVLLTTNDIPETTDNLYVPLFTEKSVPFAGVDGKLTEDNTNFQYDPAIGEMRIGIPSILDGLEFNKLNVAGDFAEGYVAVSTHNAASTGSADMIVSNDADDGTLETGIYGDFGVAGSDYTTSDDLFNKSNDVFLLASFGAGDLNIAAQGIGKRVHFATAGDTVDEIRVTIADDRTSINANKEPDIAPPLEAVDWTATGGWSAGSGQLVLVTDAGISTIEPSTPLVITPGTTYRVVITSTGVTGLITYTLGSIGGQDIVDGTITDYITATTSGNLIISGDIGAVGTITSISVRALINNTGDLFVEGNLILGSSITTIGGDSIMNIAGDGQVSFPLFPFTPNAYPTTGLEVANKAYVDNLVSSGSRFVGNVRAATTGALPANTYNNGTAGVGATLTGNANGALPAQDGVTLILDDILLVKDESAQENNGAYKVTQVGDGSNPYILERVDNYDTSAEIVTGTFFTVLEGTVNTLSQWSMITDGTVTVGTTPIVFGQLSAPISYTASNGVQLIGQDFSAKRLSGGAVGLGGTFTDELKVNVDGSTIEISSNNLQVKDAGITYAKIQSVPTATVLGRTTAGTGPVTAIALSSLSPISVANSSTLYSSGLTGTGSGAIGGYNLILGEDAGNGATNVESSTFLGRLAGYTATDASSSNFLGNQAGYGATNSNHANFIGPSAGYTATDAAYSNFIGSGAGSGATNATYSNFLGGQTGGNASAADHSNFLGYIAGFNATGAHDSNFLGQESGRDASAAANSNFLGFWAGKEATNAVDSNFLGRGAGYQATGALASNFLGANAGNGASNGGWSNMIGAGAGFNATNGNFSNFIGRYAGHNATNANSSIFIGTQAGENDTVNNSTAGYTSIAIGDLSGTGGFSNSIALGKSAVNTATNQFLIGSSYTQFNMRGVNYTMPSANAVGQLSNDGNGGLTWTTGTVRTTAPFSKTSSVALSDITGLSVNVVAGKTYKFEATLYTTSVNTAGVKAAISGTATATSIIYEGVTANTTPTAKTRATALGTTVGALTAATVATITIYGTITVNAGGTLTVQFAQNVSQATASNVLAGSTFTVTQI